MKHILKLFKGDFISRLNLKKSKFKSVRVAFTLAEGATHVAMLKNVRRCAFTLAEVLITLGIIGVVAALTMPTLIQNHQKQVYVTGLKKAYSTLQNAFSKMMVDEGITEWKQSACFNIGIYDCFGTQNGQYTIWGDTSSCLNNLQKQFKVISTSSSLSQVDTTQAGYWGEAASFVTSDGMIYLFEYGEPENADYSQDGFGLGITNITVDLNGEKGPNKYGRDKFYFKVDYVKNKIVPYEYMGYSRCTKENVDNYAYDQESNYSGKSCTAKVIIEGKMDY